MILHRSDFFVSEEGRLLVREKSGEVADMKPRITLATRDYLNGSSLELQEHDGRIRMVWNGQELAGPASKAVEQECARLACAPFRPVRQPRIWFQGAGLGYAVEAAAEVLLQKRGHLYVVEPSAEQVKWVREYCAEQPICQDSRVEWMDDASVGALAKFQSELHAIVVHIDYAPCYGKHLHALEDRRWVAAAYDALMDGGLLAVSATAPNQFITRQLERCGFVVNEHRVPSSPNAKRPRMLPVWLAHKRGEGDEE